MRRFLWRFLVLSFCLAPIVMLVLGLDRTPAVGTNPTAESLDAMRAKAVLLKLKYVLDPDYGHDRFSVSQAEADSVLALAAHSLPFLRGRARVSGTEVSATLSARIPKLPFEVWANLTLSARALGDSLQVESVELGRLTVPGPLALWVSGVAGKAVLGEDVVGLAVKGINEASIRGSRLLIGIGLTAHQRRLILSKGKSLFYALSPSNNVDVVRSYYRALDQAAYDGHLPDAGSFSAYLRFALDPANAPAGADDPAERIRSAILALAIYCGHWRVQYLVGQVITDDLKRRRSRCYGTSMGGRRDLRQHFIISAALEAVMERGLAFPAGEFKELLDSNTLWGGSGFSFADLAADRAGIHFATRILDPSLTDLERSTLIGKLTSEGTVFPDVTDLPEGVSDSDFEREFENIDAVKYQGILAAIDERIWSLQFHASPPRQ